MKTLIIYNDLQNELEFGLVDGDQSKFDGVIINSMKPHPHIDECINYLFDEKGNFNIELKDDKNLLLNKEWDTVAVITFLP